METVKGTIQRVVFQNNESGFKVLKIQAPSGPLFTVTGEFGPEVISGAVADFHGDFKQHPKYGTSFRAKSYTISHDVEKLSSIKLFFDDIAPNIGPERAQLIVDHFGNEIIPILENAPERLTEIPGIGKISADSLSKAWNENKAQWNLKRVDYSLRTFLNSMGIRERRVKKILNHFGGGLEAEEAIRENPYILTEIEGFGFSSADFIARQLGISENDPIRLKAFLLHSLKVLCLSYGHLFLTIENCINLIKKFCLDNNTSFINKTMLTPEDLVEPIKSLIKDGLIVEDNTLLYSKENYLSETRAAELITSILLKPSDLIFLTKDYVDTHIENFERESRIILSAEQKLALHYFAEKKVFIITGAAGTGKTTILRAIVDLVCHLHLTLTCLTPTGISAKKMSSTIGFDAFTIHRRLGFRGNHWLYNENNKYETDILMVDEISMVDMDVFYRLLAAVKDRTHLIFVGDDNQLPSVGAGNVLKELIKSHQIPVIKLEQIFRQSDTSDIVKAAHKIKEGDTDLSLFKPDPTADVFFLRERNVEEIEKFIIKLASKFKNERRLFQIISARNDGPLSVNTLNDLLQKVLNPPGIETECSLGSFLIRRGDRVIVIKNDYELDVFNGEIGKITQISRGFISIQFDEKMIEINIEEAVEKIKLAYCLTIHRSQGQEYPIIILPFINQYGKNMLQRNLLYTAITRAKEKVIVIGHGAALEKAINNASVYDRNTVLGERIEKCLQKRIKTSSFKRPSEPANSLIAIQKEEQSSPDKDGLSVWDLIEE